MADTEITQVSSMAVVTGTTAGTRAYQTQLMGVYNYPSDDVTVSESAASYVYTVANDVQVDEVCVMAVVRGRVENRRLRAWTFSLDGHDFYVLRLGDQSTAVLDLTTGKWSEWGNGQGTTFHAHLGQNWLGRGAATAQRRFNSNIIAGDDDFGVLWILDPEVGLDDSPFSDGRQEAFTRVAIGAVPARGRMTIPCYEAFITADVGKPAFSGAEVTLFTSDTEGERYTRHGTIVSQIDNPRQELVWLSLGQITAPGRMFKIVDDGAFTRLNGLEINDAG